MMKPPSLPRFIHFPKLFWMVLGWVILANQTLFGFVFLDTSVDKPAHSGEPIQKSNPEILEKISQPLPNRMAHYNNVLFLSADNQLIYAYLGVLKALEEYGIEVDLVLAESKAAFIASCWALGYPEAAIEKRILDNPLESFLQPSTMEEKKKEKTFHTEGPFPLQWSIPLGVQSLQAPKNKWIDESEDATAQFFHLSWMIAKLTHDAPIGPVEDLAGTPRPLAIQVTDLSTEKLEVKMEGSLQNLLKGAVLPSNIIRGRTSLWPFASGSLLSGHKVATEQLPFTLDRLILIETGPRLHASALDNNPLSWTDSLNFRHQDNGIEKGSPAKKIKQVLRIELSPEGIFNPNEPDPKKWIDLGYVSALKSMDVLKGTLTVKIDTDRAPGASEPLSAHTILSLNRVSVNPLASGGRQLLLDLIQSSQVDEKDSSGSTSIDAILASGFYSDLDLEWTRAVGEDRASIVIDAKEKSQIRFLAGWNAAITQARVTDRSPQMYGGLAWDEPFYLPFHGEVGTLLGGANPGYQVCAMVRPIYPIRLDIGVLGIHWEVLYPKPPENFHTLDAIWFPLNRDLKEVFIKVFPTQNSYLRTSIQIHEMSIPGFDDPTLEPFLSTDFHETAFLGLGQKSQGEGFNHSLRIRYRNLNRVNLRGAIKFSTSTLETKIKTGFHDFHLSDQFYWSNQDTRDFELYDLIESGRVDVFSFQDEYFLGTFRSTNFQDVKLEYSPSFGKTGVQLVVGAFRQYGPESFYPDQLINPLRTHWEAVLGVSTPLGPLRAGLGGLDGDKPLYFIKIGTDLSLGFGEIE